MRLHLVTADEQGGIAGQKIEDQPFIGDAAALPGKGGGQRDVERHFVEMHLPFEAGPFRHDGQADIFFGLEADDHRVGFKPRSMAVPSEDGVPDRLELDHDFGLAFRHPLAGAQVEGDALPAPIVDIGLYRDEGFRGRWLAQFVGIAGDDLAAHGARRILAAHTMRLDGFGGHRAQRAQRLHLFIAHRGRVHAGGRLHGDDRQNLEHMVLHHVAQRADAVIIGDAAFQAHGFADSDLDMVDAGRVPQGFEHQIAKAQRQQVLDGFLAQIMVDAENLILFEQRADAVIDLLGGSQILADRLFHRDPGERGDEAGVRQTLRRGGEQRWRGGEIDRQAAFQPPVDPIGKGGELGRIACLHRLIADHRAEGGGDLAVIAVGRQKLAQRRIDIVAEGVIVQFRPAGGDDQKIVGQQPVGQEVIERREDHPSREIPRSAE